LNGCRSDIETLTKASEEKVQDIFILQTELDKAKREITERENIITSLQSSDETHNEPLIATGSQVQRLKLDITTARADANAAKATSVEKDKHIAEFQAIAKANEEALSTQAKTLNGDIVQLKEELSHTKETLATTTTTLNQSQESLTTSLLELTNLQKENDAKQEAWNTEKQNMATMVAQEVDKCAAAVKQQTISDKHAASCDESRKIAEENYQRELLLHASDTKRVQAVEEELKHVVVSRNKFETRVAELTTEILETTRSWNTVRAGLEKRNDDSSARVVDLSTQNDLLHAQMENMTGKIQLLESSHDDTSLMEEPLPSSSSPSSSSASSFSPSSSSSSSSPPSFAAAAAAAPCIERKEIILSHVVTHLHYCTTRRWPVAAPNGGFAGGRHLATSASLLAVGGRPACPEPALSGHCTAVQL
jgi:DNA repair exonuclease SbcCD ATPase subunit